MGTIKTAIALYDGVTSPLKSMHKAMGMVLNTFEAMQEASEKTVDTAAFRAAREEWAKAGTAFDAIEESIRQANNEQDKFNRSIREGTTNANGLLSTVKKLAVAVGGVAGITKVLSLSDELASTKARLNLIVDDRGSLNTMEQRLSALAERETTIQVEASATGKWEEMEERYRGLAEAITLPVEMVQRNEAVPILKQPQEQTVEQTMFLNDEALNQSARQMEALKEGVPISAEVTEQDAVKRLEEKIMASAQRSRAAYFDTANAIASMGANAKSAFSSNDELIAFMEQINKQFVIGGASAQGQSAAMLQLTQAMGAGALRGEELNSILDNAPGIARAIEQYMGVAEGSIKQYAEQGLITSEVVKNAMFATADETNAKFESMPMTWGQIWTSMKNQALSLFSPVLTKINEIGNSSRFQQVTTGLINGLAAVANVASQLLDILISVASVFVDNWSIIQPVVLGIAAAMLLYNGYLIANNAITAISNAQKGIAAVKAYAAAAATTTLTASEKAEAMAKTSATAAQYGFNAALLACPITWVLLIIIAVIAAIYGIVAAINKLKGTTISATGMICGAVAMGGAFIGNLFISLINFGMDSFVVLWNFIAAFANFFANVFTDPVGAIVRLFFDLVDTVLSLLQSLASAIDTIFGSNFSGAVQGWRASLDGWVDSTFGKGAEVMAKVITSDYHLERFEYGDARDAGYQFGEKIFDDLFNASGWDAMGAFGLGNAIDGIYANTGDTAANTAASSDKLDIAEEDLKYMKEIAEREAINRFTTAEIHVEQHNENHISKDTDVDGIIDAWVNDFAEKLEISEEGVHE